jgi:hypothetical protein
MALLISAFVPAAEFFDKRLVLIQNDGDIGIKITISA